MKRRLGSGRISPPAGFEPATPRSEVRSANRSATRMLLTLKGWHRHSIQYTTARTESHENRIEHLFIVEYYQLYNRRPVK